MAAACASLLAAPLFGTPAQADVLIAVNKSTQSMSVVVDGRERYRWPVSTGLDGGPPSRGYQPERMERLWHSRKYDWSPMPHAIFSPSWICHPRHRLRAAARRPASHGCVRLHPSHAAQLFALVRSEGRTRIVVSNSALFADRR